MNLGCVHSCILSIYFWKLISFLPTVKYINFCQISTQYFVLQVTLYHLLTLLFSCWVVWSSFKVLTFLLQTTLILKLLFDESLSHLSFDYQVQPMIIYSVRWILTPFLVSCSSCQDQAISLLGLLLQVLILVFQSPLALKQLLLISLVTLIQAFQPFEVIFNVLHWHHHVFNWLNLIRFREICFHLLDWWVQDPDYRSLLSLDHSRFGD